MSLVANVIQSAATSATSSRCLKLQKRGQPFICAHNEAASVAAMRVSNPDRSPAAIRLGIVDHLRRRFARFKLGAHFLQASGKRFNLLLLVYGSRLKVPKPHGLEVVATD